MTGDDELAGVDDAEFHPAAQERLAAEMRRIIHLLVLVSPEPTGAALLADALQTFGDRLQVQPARQADGQPAEAGLRVQDHASHSPLSGTLNPLAPPLRMWAGPLDEQGRPTTEGQVRFDVGYEGPLQHVHGGLVAAMFDELLGSAQGSVGFTASLTVSYRRPTPLDRSLDLRAWVDRVEGRKRWIRGTCHLEGVLLTEAEGLFLEPRTGTSLDAVRESIERHSAPRVV